MMKDAESHADEDKKRKEEIEARNRADQAVYGAERLLKDTGDKLTRRRQAGDRERDGGGEEGERGQRRGGDQQARSTS